MSPSEEYAIDEIASKILQVGEYDKTKDVNIRNCCFSINLCVWAAVFNSTEYPPRS